MFHRALGWYSPNEEPLLFQDFHSILNKNSWPCGVPHSHWQMGHNTNTSELAPNTGRKLFLNHSSMPVFSTAHCNPLSLGGIPRTYIMSKTRKLSVQMHKKAQSAQIFSGNGRQPTIIYLPNLPWDLRSPILSSLFCHNKMECAEKHLRLPSSLHCNLPRGVVVSRSLARFLNLK